MTPPASPVTSVNAVLASGSAAIVAGAVWERGAAAASGRSRAAARPAHLATLLSAVDRTALTGTDRMRFMQARHGLASHVQAQLYADLHAVSWSEPSPTTSCTIPRPPRVSLRQPDEQSITVEDVAQVYDGGSDAEQPGGEQSESTGPQPGTLRDPGTTP